MAKQEKQVSTRIKLILTAERLLGERGFQHVTMKEILAEAGQKNESALQYHFGSRAGLINAVFRYRVDQLERRRIDLLAALEKEGRASDARAVLGAAIGPLVENLGRSQDNHYILFIVQALSDPQFDVVGYMFEPELEGLKRAVELITPFMPHLPADLYTLRLRLVIETAINAMATWVRRNGPGVDEHLTALFVSDLLDVMEAGIKAPVSEETRRLADQTENKQPA